MVDLLTPCTVWTGRLNSKGYGSVWDRGLRKMVLAHRQAMAQIVGWDAIKGKYVLHHCDNPPCINPEHLFIGTARENTADMTAKGRDRGRFLPRHGRFTDEQIETIRSDSRPARIIAPEYGVHHVTIHRIKTKELYS